MSAKPVRMFGKELRVGDVISLHSEYGSVITALRPYTGPLAYLFKEGAQLADLAPSPPSGITIDNGNLYSVWRQSLGSREMVEVDL